MLPNNPVALYTRKSSVDDGKQVASHEQQIEAILRHHPVPEHFPGTTIRAWWRDSITGSSFEKRPGLMGFLSEVAEKYPQPEHAPGRLFIYDESRFSRALKNGEVDLRASQQMQYRFARVGWQIVFINRPPTGNVVMDTIMDTIAFAQSSDYLLKLTDNVKRGKLSWGSKGYWLGGPPPFPARRIEAVTRRRLTAGVKSTEQTILEADPERLVHWNAGAEMLLAGRTVMDVVRYFQANVPTISNERAGRATHWSHSTIQKMYVNPALIGELHYTLGGELVVIPAKWAPIVDVDLYRRVRSELERRASARVSVGRYKGSRFVARMVRCAACGSRYRGTTTRGVRYYIHQAVREPFLRGLELERARVAGCRAYSVNAEQLEARLAKVISEHRCSADAVIEVVRRHEQRNASNDQANRLSEMRAAIARLEAQYANVREALRDTLDANVRRDLLEDGSVLRRQVQQARFEHATEEARLAALQDSTAGLRRTLDETARVATNWERSSDDERQAILDQWLEHVFIDVEQPPRREQKRTAYFLLAESPTSRSRDRARDEIVSAFGAMLQRAKELAARAPSGATLPITCYLDLASPRCRSSRAP